MFSFPACAPCVFVVRLTSHAVSLFGFFLASVVPFFTLISIFVFLRCCGIFGPFSFHMYAHRVRFYRDTFACVLLLDHLYPRGYVPLLSSCVKLYMALPFIEEHLFPLCGFSSLLEPTSGSLGGLVLVAFLAVVRSFGAYGALFSVPGSFARVERQYVVCSVVAELCPCLLVRFVRFP